jgi:hypothetical protein
MNRLGVCVILLFSASSAFAVSPDPKHLDVPPGEVRRARELISKLGSEVYTEREQAQRDLCSMGRLAKPALVEAVSTVTDAEVRRRVFKLLPQAAQEDVKARVAAFLADKEGRFEHSFPGWTSYRKHAGNMPEARAFFAEMLKDTPNQALLAALEGPPENLAKLQSDRRTEVWNWKFPRTPNATKRDPTLADLAVLVLIEAEAPKLPGVGIGMSSMLSSSSFYSGPMTGPQIDIFRKLLGHWVNTRDQASPAILYNAVTVSVRFDLPEAAGCAVRLLDGPKVTSYYRGLALAVLSRSGTKEHLPSLEKCFDDETLYTKARPQAGQGGVNDSIDVRVQDMALAAAVLVTGQKPSDYYFHEWTPPTSVSVKSRYINYYVRSVDRAAAFAKFAEWRQRK